MESKELSIFLLLNLSATTVSSFPLDTSVVHWLCELPSSSISISSQSLLLVILCQHIPQNLILGPFQILCLLK
jgi:hypothetical protein